MTATDAKAEILALLDDVTAGDEVLITRHGRVVARLVPAGRPRDLRSQLAGTARSAADDDELFTTGEVWTSARRGRSSTPTSCTGGPPSPSG